MTISLVGNRVFGYLGHLQLVRGSVETEVQAPFPQAMPLFGTWDFGAAFEKPHAVNDVSTIGDPATYSSGEVTLDDGIDEEGAWSIFEQVREQLIPLNLPYDVNFNSNSYINTLLTAIGHTAAEFMTYPTTVTLYPGSDRDVASGFWGLEYTLVGGGNGDVIHGGRGDDTLFGGDGVDFLKGGKGSDHIYANVEGTPEDAVADYLEGGGGRDTFHVGNTDLEQGLFIYNSITGETTFNEQARGTYDLILDYSRYDNLAVTWFGGTDTPFSNFTVTSAEYTLGGKDVYFAVSGDFQLSAIYDSYYDENLGRSVDVMVFWYQVLARVASDGASWELNTPLFAIETPAPTVGRFSLSELVNGTLGDDDLIGTTGDDAVYGGDGADSISGEEGDDILFGENGDDDFYARDDDGADSFDGGAGTNSIIYEGDADLVFDTAAGTISAAGQATDNFSNISVFYGSNGDDTFLDSSQMRFFSGGEGTDTAVLSGNVTSYRIYIGAGGYNIERADVDRDGNADSRWLRLEGVENVTIGGVAISLENAIVNNISGTSASETISGTAISDLIKAGAGDDVIYGGAGSDLIDGGEGTNRVEYDGVRSDYEFSQNSDGTVSVGRDTEGYDVLSNIHSVYFRGDNSEFLIGNLVSIIPGDATVIGSTASDVLYGGTSGDVLYGGTGDDQLQGGAGSDTYSFQAGDGNDVIDDWGDPTSIDVIRFEEGVDPEQISVIRGLSDIWDIVLRIGLSDSITIIGGFYPGATVVEAVHFNNGTQWSLQQLRAGYLTQAATVGDDTIHGFLETDDTISGAAGANTIYGYSGNDAVFGGAGDDTLFGAEGNDVLVGDSGADSLMGGDGDDRIYADADDVWFSGDSGNDTLVYTGADDREISLVQGSFENIRAGQGNNTVWGGDEANIIEGEEGDDTLFGFGGDDILFGGAGADSLMGGDGNDEIHADADDSWFAGDDGVDTLIYTSSDAFDYALAQGEFENVKAGAGDNTIWGTSAANVIDGEAGADTLFGYEGDDTLLGGTGADELSGGIGDDTFVFRSNFGQDTVVDFQAGESSVDAIEFQNTLFSNFTEVLAASTQVGSDTLITYDVDNVVTLSNVALTSLHQDDFRFVA
ncbi:calcium-binding protein [Peteryoungia ipomoeae]|uniref:Calcium-binding protein n=2 Tax=Rhizobiaceae TaxID=82115 RepID=A0A4S8NRE1_9HYPH|nr:calcium-binding protein [Peteryoungia ipomoeae]THV19833.1 calcium-binding protein [Peteryoungia ipomoeae]